MSDGAISFCAYLLKYTTLQLHVTGSCETDFRFVICLSSLPLRKGTVEGLKGQVHGPSAGGV